MFQAIRAKFATSGFLFEDSYVDVISGNEEATFAWISAQYLSGNLKNILNGNPSVDTGILDLGGASTQIAFQANPIFENAMRVQVGLKEESIYAVSFLQYGSDYAKSLALGALTVEDVNGTKTAEFPCYFTGYEENATIAGETVLVSGSSNYTACAELTRSILGLGYPCSYENCSIRGVYQPIIAADKSFYAVSAYYYGVHNLKLPSNSTIQEIIDKLEEVCSLNWTEAQSTFGSPMYLETYCFQPAYGVTLLKDAYGFPVDERRFIFAKQINGTSVEWSTGAILYQSNLMSFFIDDSAIPSPVPTVSPTTSTVAPSPEPAVSTGGWVAITLFVGVLCAVGTAVITRRLWHRPSAYQNIQSP
jgi:hypothetical protein